MTAMVWVLCCGSEAWAASPLEEDRVELGTDEGVLVLAIDSNMDVDRLELRRDGAFLPVDKLSNIPGQNVRYFVYVLEAGDYYIRRIWPDHGANRRYFEPPRNVSEFSVKPGIVNYPGTFIVRIQEDALRGSFFRHNRASLVMQFLDAAFPKTIEKFQLQYVGVFEDPFIAYWQELQAGEAQ